MKTNNPGIKALTTSEELVEIQAVGQKKLKLKYRGQMAWSKQHGIDSRMWDVLEPKLSGYTYDNGYPTFTITGLKERGLL